MAYDEGLAQRIRELVGDHPAVTERKMFSGLTFRFNGNIACGVHGEFLIVRLPADASTAALTEPGTHTFNPNGQPANGWILVGPEAYTEDDDLSRWVARGIEYAETLPPK